MNQTGLSTEIESVLLTTLVTLMPTNARWLRRIRFLLLIALLIRAWMNQQSQSQYVTSYAAPYQFAEAETDGDTSSKRKPRSRKKAANA